jgi:hypothetical protein
MPANAAETTEAIDIDELDDFTIGYLETALWSTTDNTDDSGGSPLDDNYDLYDIDPTALASAVSDCDDFQVANVRDLRGIDESQAGHDFWLTRNGHGAGFWDRGLGAKGDRLTTACKAYGSADLYIGDDDKIHGF